MEYYDYIWLPDCPMAAARELFSHPRDDGDTPLMICSIIGRADITRIILGDPEFEETMWDKGAALFEAVAQGHLEVVSAYVEALQSLEHVRCNITPLHRAVSCANLPMVRLLLDAGANVEGAPNITDTPIYTAAGGSQFEYQDSNKYVEVARLLLEAGAKVDPSVCIDYKRCTPLSHAARKKNYSMSSLLLDWGASTSSASIALCRKDRKTLRSYCKAWESAKERQHFNELHSKKVEARTQKKLRQKSKRAETKATLTSPSTCEAECEDVVDSEDLDSFCVACIDNPREVLILPCGHLILCMVCVLDMIAHSAKRGSGLACCPFCSEPIVDHCAMSP